MKRLRVVHSTGFRYEGEVSASYNEARMLPSHGDGQFVLSSHIDVSPTSSQYNYVDYWGSRVSAIEVITPHRELTITANSLVEVGARPHDEHVLDWAGLEVVAASRAEFVEQTVQTRRTAPPDDLVELARGIAEGIGDPCQAAHEICRTIGEAMQYMAGVSTVNSVASEAWTDRKGVCQDIAHVALGALRSVGIPARYVSGYLHPRPSAEIGETVVGESHAWVEWFCGGWRGWDPTNLIDIGDRHVIVGRGRDYDDVPPMRGVFAGSSGSSLFVKVELTRET